MQKTINRKEISQKFNISINTVSNYAKLDDFPKPIHCNREIPMHKFRRKAAYYDMREVVSWFASRSV